MVETSKHLFKRLKARVVNYGDDQFFENKLFREELLYELSSAALEENAESFEEFIQILHVKKNHIAST